MSTFSLYEHNSGSLKHMDWQRKRTKYETYEKAVEAARKRIAKLRSLVKPEFLKFYDNIQVLVVEFTEPYKGKIVGIISNEPIKQETWQ